MSKKRKTTWSDKYSDEFGYIQKVAGYNSKAFCSICCLKFSIVHGGRSDIVDHSKTNRHKSGTSAGSSSKKVSDYFKSITANNDELITAGKEATFAYHTARHNMSFRSSDCSAGLIRTLYDSKFTLAKTKLAAIVSNVIAPHINKRIDDDLNTVSFISIMTDTSNHKNIKILPIIIRYFDPDIGVINKKIATVSIPNEKSETIVKELLKAIVEKNISDKVVAFSADNTNLNFGGVERKGQNNVWRKLQKELGRSIIGNGCFAHIAHNASAAGCEILDVDIEAIVVKIFKHFSIHTVRSEQLKELCSDLNEEYNPLKSYSGTRFLTLEPAVKRVIEMFESLEKYFLELKKCPPLLRTFFSSKQGKFWFLFISNQLKNFNECIKFMESSSKTAFEAFDEIQLLKLKLINRRRCSFIPTASVIEFEKLNESIQNMLKEKIDEFYATIIDYITLWEKSIDGSEVFVWIILRKCPEWDDVEKSLKYIEERYGMGIHQIINRDIIIDEFHLLHPYIQDNLRQWIDIDKDKVWSQIFLYFQRNLTRLTNMEKLVAFAFTLAGTSTEVERIFSLMSQIWDDQKSRLEIPTFDALLTIQYNSTMNCNDFYKNIKNDSEFLEKVHTGEKYN